MLRALVPLLVIAGLLSAGTVSAAPRHDICADLGDSFAFGVSSYGPLREWLVDANEQQGADFKLAYVYILDGGMDDPQSFEEWYVRPFAEAAQAIGAIPVFTYYQLLDIGEASGFSGSEPEIVAQTLGSPIAMRTYFDNFIWLLEIAQSLSPPVVVHVEPDSWGFMMWAMGIEGNGDATSVPVEVAGSGHPDLGGFPDHAGGLGQALLALRDAYAPDVRLGWHASNFRVGTRPEVVTAFYSAMGDWDVLVGEHPHVEGDEANWWEPWDEGLLDINLQWLQSVTAGAGVPLLLWQMPVGTSDWHLLGDGTDRSTLERFVEAGAAALMFEHLAYRSETDPDEIRAVGDLGTTPPAGDPAGGTAADMRARVAAYAQSPLVWPPGSLCDRGITTGDPLPVGDAGPSGELGSTAPSDGASTEDGGGCGCTVVEKRSTPWAIWVASALLMSTALLRRTRKSRSQGRRG